ESDMVEAIDSIIAPNLLDRIERRNGLRYCYILPLNLLDRIERYLIHMNIFLAMVNLLDRIERSANSTLLTVNGL
ncbi:MAG: hypothetical protein ACP5ML_04945, partial [Fervidicoccus sp.]